MVTAEMPHPAVKLTVLLGGVSGCPYSIGAGSMRGLEGFADFGGAGQVRLRVAAGLFHQPEHRVGQGIHVSNGVASLPRLVSSLAPPGDFCFDLWFYKEVAPTALRSA